MKNDRRDKLKKYIKINKFMGSTLLEEVDKVVKEGLMDADTRLFLNHNTCITPEDLAEMLPYFNIEKDYELSNKNVVFVPKEKILRRD